MTASSSNAARVEDELAASPTFPPPRIPAIRFEQPSRWSTLVNAFNKLAPTPSSTSSPSTAGQNMENGSSDSHGFFPLRLLNVPETTPPPAAATTWPSRRMKRRSRIPIPTAGMYSLRGEDGGQSSEPLASWKLSSRSRMDLDDTLTSQYDGLHRQHSHIDNDEPLSIVVVDNNLFIGANDTVDSERTDVESISNGLHNTTPSQSTSGPSPGQSSMSEGTRYGERQSLIANTRLFWTGRVWPALCHFNNQTFPEPAKESLFQKEAWYSAKKGALWAALFFLITWIAFCSFLGSHTMLYWVYPAICGLFTVPLPFIVAFDLPLRSPWLYQLILLASVWTWPFFQVAEMHMCHFFGGGVNQCHGIKFLTLFGVLLGYPTISCLVMGQNRVLNMVAACAWMGYGCAVMFQDLRAALSVARNPIQYALYQIFLLILSYAKEKADRQLFELREQLKKQYRAVQAAQVMERKAEQSKKRFVSYIFHEVRVPLNTALLAVQNLREEGVFKNLHVDMDDMVQGLMGSLNMMEKVLNDVLSFNRMESGKFAQVRRPFCFNKSIQLAALSHRAQADKAGIEFTVDLDPRISKLDRLVGDEMRLRQITSNLVSNALKFTQSGSVRLITSLLYPTGSLNGKDTCREVVPISERQDRRLSTLSEVAQMSGFSPRKGSACDVEKGDVSTELERNNYGPAKSFQKPRKAVVRVEVRDTGVGIAKEDLDDGQLFSPYVQTEIGRRQGGKGSGLGLALIRQLIQLSGGRLGVDSQVGVGSTFWFELPFTLSTPSSTSAGERRPSLSRPTVPPLDSLVPLLASPRSMEGPYMALPDEPVSFSKGYSGLHQEGLAAQMVPSPVSVSPCTTLAFPSPTETLVNEEPPPFPPPPPPSPRERPDPLYALVVDDDVLTRKLMSRMLKRLGHEVVTASNGQEGLDMIVASHEPGCRHFDVVFLDNQMPRMSGVEAVAALRRMGLNTFVVGCTGNALREDQEEYLSAGAHELLPKPVHQSGIEEMLVEARRRRDIEALPLPSSSFTRRP